MQPLVHILLSVYNGECFLKEQLDSIFNQTYTNWQILIKDDGSVDRSREIIDQYTTKYPAKVIWLDLPRTGSATDSFLQLVQHADAPYMMFCDQDDYWFSNKIEISIAGLSHNSKNNVHLLYTDMEVVDAHLSKTHSSFLQQHKLNPTWRLNQNIVLAQSLAAGCTQLFTRELASLLRPVNSTLFQHDHWLMIHASLYGTIEYLPETTVKYRQHNFNSIGAHGVSAHYFAQKSANPKVLYQRWKYLQKTFPEYDLSIFKLALAKLSVNARRALNLA